jgi:hypothetical protein
MSVNIKKQLVQDYIEVRPQPTVVRLEHLKSNELDWITQSYFITDEVKQYLLILQKQIEGGKGCGFFLVGPYGSGKSHFLAFLSRLMQINNHDGKRWLNTPAPQVMPISLLNYGAEVSLETILIQNFELDNSAIDRREMWQVWMNKHPEGVLIVIDELSEFLRSKPTPQLFNEDIRFLQFLGEWATAQPLWIVATLQEHIERTGIIEGALFRKIKDRYPHRFLLSPAHIKDILQKHILRRKPEFHQAAMVWLKQLQMAFPALTDAKLNVVESFYPLHPVTLEFLEEIRDLFSQSRGSIEFVLQQVNGPFLQEEFGTLITPDFIIKHFLDLLEIQPEFTIISQKLLPYYKKQMPELFENEVQQRLAWKLLYLLILIHLSPRREKVSSREATYFLLNKLSMVDPKKNEAVIDTILNRFKDEGAFVAKNGESFCLNLQDNPQNFERLLQQAQSDMTANILDVFATLEPLLKGAAFNPFDLITSDNQRANWERSFIRFFGHQRSLAVSLNSCNLPPPREPACEINLQVEIAWDDSGNVLNSKFVVIRPQKILGTQDLIAIAALVKLGQQALTPQEKIKVTNLLTEQKNIWLQKVYLAYRELELIFQDGRNERLLVPDSIRTTWDWLQFVGDRALKIYYPAFENFACILGPLASDTYKQWLEIALTGGGKDSGRDGSWLESNAPVLHAVREGYLVPMGLIRKLGPTYKVIANLEKHELVDKLERILPHQNQPKFIYEYFAQPIYGLVPDQVHVLLLFLLLQGNIDFEKGEQSFRDCYREMMLPIQFDKILLSRGLPKELLDDLVVLADFYNIDTRHCSSIITQRQIIQKIRRRAQEVQRILGDFVLSLGGESEQNQSLLVKMQKVLSGWRIFLECDDDLWAFEQFISEINSLKQFINLQTEMLEYPKFYQSSVREIERFQFLFSHHSFISYFENNRANLINAETVATGVSNDSVGVTPVASESQPEGPTGPLFQLKSPDISDIEEVKIWLKKSELIYREYCSWYKGQHYDFWLDFRNKIQTPLVIPLVAKSRHLGLKLEVMSCEVKWTQLKRSECTGISSLDFLPICRCGYEVSVLPGAHPIVDLLVEYQSQHLSILDSVEQFFAQSEVKAKISEWQESQSLLADTQSSGKLIEDKLIESKLNQQREQIALYLEGKIKFPDISDVSGFEEALAGAKVIHKVSSAEFFAIYKNKTVWRKTELANEFQTWLQKQPEYIHFIFDDLQP